MTSELNVRLYILVLAGLLSIVIGLAARSYTGLPEIPIDPAVGVDADSIVPAPVMSTLRRACFDCHSDQTRWPWYSGLPVASWLIERDISAGRGQLNFSRWMNYNRFDRADLLDKACELVRERVMPLWQYRIMHRDARLTETDIAALCDWSRLEAARHVGEGP
jgi:heme-binding protein